MYTYRLQILRCKMCVLASEIVYSACVQMCVCG